MIVQCPSCRTRFRVDETRIPGRGARMRCRRCGEAIIVMKVEEQRPTAPPERRNLFDLRSVLRRSQEGPAGRTEGPVLEEAAPSAFPAPGAPDADAGRPDLLSRELHAEAVDARAEDRREATAPEAAEPRSEPPEGLQGDAVAATEQPGNAGGTYLRVPDGLPADAPAQPREEAPEAGQEEAVPEAAEPGETEAPEPLSRAEAEFGSPAQDTLPREDRNFDLVLDDTEALDFLKEEFQRGQFDISLNVRPHPSPEEDEEEARMPAAAAAPPDEEPMDERLEAIQRELEEIGGGAPQAAPMPAAPLEPAPAPGPAAPKPPTPTGRARQDRAARPAVVTLLVLFLVIAAGGAYLGFTRGGQQILRNLVPGMESLWLGGAGTAPRYDVANLIGYYETNAEAGRLFVIRGVVTNQGREKRSGIRIHAGLLAASGRTVAEMTVYAGNVLSGNELRSSSRQSIEKEMANRWGDRLVNMDVAPGKSVPFMVVFFDPPEGIEEYRLDAREIE